MAGRREAGQRPGRCTGWLPRGVTRWLPWRVKKPLLVLQGGKGAGAWFLGPAFEAFMTHLPPASQPRSCCFSHVSCVSAAVSGTHQPFAPVVASAWWSVPLSFLPFFFFFFLHLTVHSFTPHVPMWGNVPRSRLTRRTCLNFQSDHRPVGRGLQMKLVNSGRKQARDPRLSKLCFFHQHS